MESVVEQPMTQASRISVAPPPRWREIDETAARRTLRAQIGKLERELGHLAARTTPRDAVEWSIGAPAPRGPRLLSLGELERVRDDLAERVHAVRLALAERAEREALGRDQLARMLRNPEEHRFVRIARTDVGEPGCGAWESRPRLGIIGMLAGWWHVKVSSGCPLATAGASVSAPGPDTESGEGRGCGSLPHTAGSTSSLVHDGPPQPQAHELT